MNRRLEELQAGLRRARFVGRRRELAQFRRMLAQRPRTPRVLWIHGPAGVGKTALLHELAQIARDTGVKVTRLDGRDLEPTPIAFTRAVAVGSRRARVVVFVDTYETMTPLDRWLREVWLPALPPGMTVVLSGRVPPGHEWRSDPGWGELLCVLSLDNFDAADTRRYLERSGVGAAQHDAIAAFTRGHPLSLALVVDTLAKTASQEFIAAESPDVVEELLRRLVGTVPSDAHAEALELCALAHSVNEALLQALVRHGKASALFRWLRGLSCIAAGPKGLYPHDLVREILVADLRWRNLDRYRDLCLRLSGYFARETRSERYEHALRSFAELAYVGRRDPAVGVVLERTAADGIALERASAADVPALIRMVRRHEGARSAQIAEHWLARQRDVVVAREIAGPPDPLGFVLILALERATPEELSVDPSALACWRYLEESAPLRHGERASLARYWLTSTGQDLDSPVLASLGGVLGHHHATLPGLAFSFVQVHDPVRFAAFGVHSDFDALEAARAEIDGLRHGMFGKDWRRMSQDVWIRRMQARAAGLPPDAAPAASGPQATVLHRVAFAAAVRSALGQLHDAALARSPLLQTRMVSARVGNEDTPVARVEALRALLREAGESLRTGPRAERGHRALEATYLQPVGTQEDAAAAIGLAFSTYRRHLYGAIDAVVETLWLVDTSAPVADDDRDRRSG